MTIFGRYPQLHSQLHSLLEFGLLGLFGILGAFSIFNASQAVAENTSAADFDPDLGLELDTSFSSTEQDGFTQGHRLQGKIAFPRLSQELQHWSKRLVLAVEPSDPQQSHSQAPARQQYSHSLGLQLQDAKVTHLHYLFGHDGLTSLFTGVRYQPEFNHLRFNQLKGEFLAQARYFSNNSSDVLLQPQLTQPLNAQWQQQLIGSYRYQSQNAQHSVNLNPQWHWQFSPNRRISLGGESQASTQASSEHNLVWQSHNITLSHRWRAWQWHSFGLPFDAYLNSHIFSQWQRTENFRFDPGVAVGFSIKVSDL